MSDKKVSFPSINEKIVEGIAKNANPQAVDRVVSKRVDVEIQRRADLLEKALDKYNVTKKEYEKCGPDQRNFSLSEDGVSVKHEFYSEKRLLERGKLQKLIAELDVAIMNAFSDKPDLVTTGYKKLQDLLSSGGSQKKDEKKDEAAENA